MVILRSSCFERESCCVVQAAPVTKCSASVSHVFGTVVWYHAENSSLHFLWFFIFFLFLILQIGSHCLVWAGLRACCVDQGGLALGCYSSPRASCLCWNSRHGSACLAERKKITTTLPSQPTPQPHIHFSSLLFSLDSTILPTCPSSLIWNPTFS